MSVKRQHSFVFGCYELFIVILTSMYVRTDNRNSHTPISTCKKNIFFFVFGFAFNFNRNTSFSM